jgi:hypothetical protein
MLSLRESLPNIGINLGTPVSYRSSFASRPASLRQAIRSMDAPRNWQYVRTKNYYDEDWTEACQGVAFDGVRWIFSCNKSGNPLLDSPAALYVFNAGTTLTDAHAHRILMPRPDNVDPSWECHSGQITYFDGKLYVAYYYHMPMASTTKWSGVIVLRDDGGNLSFERYIPLMCLENSPSTGKPCVNFEFQGINPWNGQLLTCNCDGAFVNEFYFHDPLTGNSTGILPLKYPCIAVQGACCSPNGHMYVSVDRFFRGWEKKTKWIFVYSLLNGALMNKIQVGSENDDQELEGLCYADVSWPDGRKAQIHLVVLDNVLVARDNLWFRSFSADQPEVV